MEGAEQHDDADDEAPGNCAYPATAGIRLPGGPTASPKTTMNISTAGAVRHHSHVVAALGLAELPGEVGMNRLPAARRSPVRIAEHRIGGQLNNPQAEADQDDHVASLVDGRRSRSSRLEPTAVPHLRFRLAFIACLLLIAEATSPVAHVRRTVSPAFIPYRAAMYARQPPNAVISRCPSHRKRLAKHAQDDRAIPSGLPCRSPSPGSSFCRSSPGPRPGRPRA